MSSPSPAPPTASPATAPVKGAAVSTTGAPIDIASLPAEVQDALKRATALPGMVIETPDGQNIKIIDPLQGNAAYHTRVVPYAVIGAITGSITGFFWATLKKLPKLGTTGRAAVALGGFGAAYPVLYDVLRTRLALPPAPQTDALAGLAAGAAMGWLTAPGTAGFSAASRRSFRFAAVGGVVTGLLAAIDTQRGVREAEERLLAAAKARGVTVDRSQLKRYYEENGKRTPIGPQQQAAQPASAAQVLPPKQ